MEGWLLLLMLAALIATGAHGLQCYQCRGITYMGPNGCIEPLLGYTPTQECEYDQVCEKRQYRIMEDLMVVERGCSNNCRGRDYIWTDEYQVFCCDDDNHCNTATRHTGVSALTMMVTVAVTRWLQSL